MSFMSDSKISDKLEDLESRLLQLEIICKLQKKEEKTENLTFEEALVYLKKGRKITRLCWRNDRIYVYLYRSDRENFADEFRVFTVARTDCIWSMNHAEILADDWRVVDES